MFNPCEIARSLERAGVPVPEPLADAVEIAAVDPVPECLRPVIDWRAEVAAAVETYWREEDGEALASELREITLRRSDTAILARKMLADRHMSRVDEATREAACYVVDAVESAICDALIERRPIGRLRGVRERLVRIGLSKSTHGRMVAAQ